MWVMLAAIAGLALFLVVPLAFVPWYIAVSLFCVFMSWQPRRSERLRGSHLGGALRVAASYKTKTVGAQPLNLDKATNYVFAMHPHGVFCASELLTFIFPNTLSVFEEFVEEAIPLVASELLYVPGLGQLAAALGCESVGQNNLETHIRAKHSVALIPGGVREMALAPQNTAQTVYIVHREGFLHLAYRNHTAVVPILSLNESSCHHTFNSVGILQRFCIWVFGYPFPMLAFGWWGTFWPRKNSSITILADSPHIPSDYATMEEFTRQYYVRLVAMAASEGVEVILQHRDGTRYEIGTDASLEEDETDASDAELIQERSETQN